MAILPKNKLQWIEILISPFILSLFISIIVILFLPDVFEKYIVNLTKSELAYKPNSYEEYLDLDSDGYSERIVVFPTLVGLTGIQVLSHDMKTIDQWNFIGKCPIKGDFVGYGDLDLNGIKEIYLFTIESDSVLLHSVAPFTENLQPFENRFITLIQWFNDTIDADIEHIQCKDLNGDGFPELIFVVEAGYSRQPRIICAYDYQKDTTYKSETFGANFGDLIIADIDHDGIVELFLPCNTLGNISDSSDIPFDDYSSYLFGLNNEMELLFTPIEYSNYPSSATLMKINFESDSGFVLMFRNCSLSGDSSQLMLYDSFWNRLKIKNIDPADPLLSGGLWKLKSFFEQGIIILRSGEKAVLLDRDLSVTNVIDVAGIHQYLISHDLNMDCSVEHVFTDKQKNLLFFEKDLLLAKSVKTNWNSLSYTPPHASIKSNGNYLPELFIRVDDMVYFYSLKINNLYYLKYPLWIVIYFLIVFILLILKYLQKIQLQRKAELTYQLNSLQLKTIKSQMDPHFMFNAINSISYAMMKKDPETAYKFFIKFSHLVKSLFSNADQMTYSLEEELSFVRMYLELQQFRFKKNLEFSIEIKPNLDLNVAIPRMLLQLFVENSIKHGISNKNGSGYISIKCTTDNSHYKISVQDDGIGREEARKINPNSGLGIKLIDEMINLYEKVKGIRILYQYNDLVSQEGCPTGTLVEIHFPISK